MVINHLLNGMILQVGCDFWLLVIPDGTKWPLLVIQLPCKTRYKWPYTWETKVIILTNPNAPCTDYLPTGEKWPHF